MFAYESCRILFDRAGKYDSQKFADHLIKSANKPSAFTYSELTQIYGLIKPYRNFAQIPNQPVERLATFYDKNYMPTQDVIGSIHAERGDKSLIFYLNKEATPNEPAMYHLTLAGKTYQDRLEIETGNFSIVLSKLQAHLLNKRTFDPAVSRLFSPTPV